MTLGIVGSKIFKPTPLSKNNEPKKFSNISFGNKDTKKINLS